MVTTAGNLCSLWAEDMFVTLYYDVNAKDILNKGIIILFLVRAKIQDTFGISTIFWNLSPSYCFYFSWMGSQTSGGDNVA